MARLTKDQRRLLVAHSLLHLDTLWRQDVDELVEWLGITAGNDGYFGDREELRGLLLQATETVLTKFSGLTQFQQHHSLLKSVLSGVSINQWAKDHQQHREHVSRTTWTLITSLVLAELEPLRKREYSTTSAKIRPRD